MLVYKNASRLTNYLKLFLIIYFIASFVYPLNFILNLCPLPEFIKLDFNLLLLLLFAFFAPCSFVLYLFWLYRLNVNTRALGKTSLSISPGWAVGWHFIPFANLVKPYQAIKEIWDANLLYENKKKSYYELIFIISWTFEVSCLFFGYYFGYVNMQLFMALYFIFISATTALKFIVISKIQKAQMTLANSENLNNDVHSSTSSDLQHYIDLKRTTKFTSIAIITSIIISIATIITVFTSSEYYLPEEILYIKNIILFAMIISYLFWMYRSNSNTRALGIKSLEITPEFAVGWNFIPLCNFIMPYLALREV